MLSSMQDAFNSTVKKAGQISPLRKDGTTLVVIIGGLIFLSDSSTEYIDAKYDIDSDSFSKQFKHICRISGQIYPIKDFNDLQPKMKLVNVGEEDPKLSQLFDTLKANVTLHNMLLNGRSSTNVSLYQNSLSLFVKEIFVASFLMTIVIYQVVLHCILGCFFDVLKAQRSSTVRSLFGVKIVPSKQKNLNNSKFIYEDVIMARMVGIIFMYASLRVTLYNDKHGIERYSPLTRLPDKFICIVKVLEQDATYSQRILFAIRKAGQPQGELLILLFIILIFLTFSELLNLIKS